MAKTVRDHLLDALENLEAQELKRLKAKLNELPVRPGYDNIPKGRLQQADALDLSDLLVGYYTEGYAVQVTVQALEAVNCKAQAEKLREVAGIAGKPSPGGRASPALHFIDRHREELIQRTATVEGVLDMLYGTVLDDEQYQRIASRGTSQEKMRELYSLMRCQKQVPCCRPGRAMRQQSSRGRTAPGHRESGSVWPAILTALSPGFSQPLTCLQLE